MAKIRQNAIAVISANGEWKVPFKDDDFGSKSLKNKLSKAIENSLSAAESRMNCDAILVEIDLENISASLIKNAIEILQIGFQNLIDITEPFERRQGRQLIIRLEPYDRKSAKEETRSTNNEATKQTFCLTKLFQGGNLSSLNDQFEPQASEFAELMSKHVPTIRELKKIENKANSFIENFRSFKADKLGYQQSSQVIDIVHDIAFRTRSSICIGGQPAFARRLLPPIKDGNGRVIFAYHQMSDESAIEKWSSIRQIELKPTGKPDSDVNGNFQIYRQRMIEQFRSQIDSLAGKPAETIEDAKGIKKLVNEHRRRLGVSLGVVLGGEITQVSLEVSYKSFQLKQGRHGYIKEFSGQKFPELLLIDSHFNDILSDDT